MVRDTDGSAFITKAEFDSLKNNFQAQVDNYNSSIDSKIDGAIASYLAGIKVASELEDRVDALYLPFTQLPLENIKSNAQILKSMEHCYFQCEVNLMRLMYPNTVGTDGAFGHLLRCSALGAGCRAFLVDNYTKGSDNIVLECGDNCNMFFNFTNVRKNRWSSSFGTSLKYWKCYAQFYDHDFNYVYASGTYTNPNWPSRKKTNGWCMYNIQAQSTWSTSTSTYSYTGGFAFMADGSSASARETTTIPYTIDKNDTSINFSSSCRIDFPVSPYLNFINGSTSKFWPLMVSQVDLRVPGYDRQLYLDTDGQKAIYAGVHFDSIPLSSDANWQVADTAAFVTNSAGSTSTSGTNYRDVDYSAAIKTLPTFGMNDETTFTAGDTFFFADDLIKKADIDGDGTDDTLHLYSGLPLAKMGHDKSSLKFNIELKNTVNSKNYKLLFSKNAQFDHTKISSETTIPYNVNSVAHTTGTYISAGTYEIEVPNLSKDDVIWMQWVTNDSDDGGTVNSMTNIMEKYINE